MKKSKRSHLIAKRTEAGDVALWLSQSLWFGIRDGLVRSYLDDRRCIGEEEARKKVDKPRVGDGWAFGERHSAVALEAYKIGWDRWVEPYNEAEHPSIFITPSRLVEVGDREQQRGFDEELRRLTPEAERKAA